MKLRPAFTLFELILAMSLSAILLALIGTAVNLYLVRMDSGRTRVEEAQLARSILSTIAADIRATTIYQTQDISSVEQLAAAAAEFDPDSFDAAGNFGASELGATGGSGQGGAGQGSGQGGSGMTSGNSSSGTTGVQTASTTLQPGVNGLVNELQLDVSRLPRLDELFPPLPQGGTGPGSAVMTAAPRPSDLKSVRYFVRQGAAIDPSDAAASAISPELQQRAGGLVRQSLDRAIRDVAEQSANSQLLASGQALLAPEVTQVRFVYFDGTAAVDQWDMQERGSMPTAIEVRIWIAPDAIDAESSTIPLEPRMYSQTIALPLAATSQAAAATSGQEQSAAEDPSMQESTGDESGSQFGSETPTQ